jgi:hypothetical protein
MHATADSRILKIKGSNRRHLVVVIGILVRKVPKRDISRCPAIKLAVNRTQRVIGRIRFLTISISTINTIRRGGVLWGSKCANIWLVFLVHANIIMENQKIKEIGKVTARCEVTEKIWGYRAMKFNVKMVIKTVIIMLSTLF